MATYTDLMSLFNDIGSAINDKGVNGQHYPYQMASAIRSIPTGISVSGTYSVSSAGTFNIASYESVYVSGVSIKTTQTLNSSTAIVNFNTNRYQGGWVSGGQTGGALALPSISISTITPSSTSQVAVSQYTWTLNDVVVEAIPDSYIIPSGNYTVTKAGDNFDIKQYANLIVPEAANPSVSIGFSASTAKFYATGYAHRGYLSTNKNTGSSFYTLESTSISHITPLSTSQVAVPQYRWTLNEVIVDAIPSSYIIPEGTYEITTNGTYDIKNYASVSVAIPVGETINNYTAAAVTPTESSQTISVPTGYTGLNAVTVNAISSTYVGTGVPVGSTSYTMTSSKYTVTTNAGYYSGSKTNAMLASSITTPSITINNTTGLITGVASAQFSSYYSAHSKSGTLQLATQAAATITPSTTSQTAVSAYTWTTGAVTVAAIPVSTLLSTAINGTSYLETTGDYGFRTTITIPEGWYSATEISKEFSSILPGLSTQAKASQILDGYQVYDGDGKIVSGAMTNNGAYNGTLNSVTTSITIPSGYHNGSGVISHTTVAIPAPTMTFNSATGVLTASGNWTRGFTTNSTYTSTYSFTIRSAANLTTSGSTVTVPAGYYATQATKNVASATHAAPALSLNSTTGVITATHTQTAGYVAAGTTSSTLTLTTQAATTITPSTASQTAVAANRYTTGAVTVGPIPSTYKQLSSTTTATAANITVGETAYNSNGQLITGELQIIKYYTGTTVPNSSLGSDGDIYLQG